MNANELADALQETEPYYSTDYKLFDKAATMLRQQHAELDAFKLQYYNTGYSIQLRDKDETMRQQQAEIEALKEVNAKQADYIAEQKSAYEKLWSEHMELFWKHEQDTDLTNE